jgi:hypothetical protein
VSLAKQNHNGLRVSIDMLARASSQFLCIWKLFLPSLLGYMYPVSWICILDTQGYRCHLQKDIHHGLRVSISILTRVYSQLCFHVNLFSITTGIHVSCILDTYPGYTSANVGFRIMVEHSKAAKSTRRRNQTPSRCHMQHKRDASSPQGSNCSHQLDHVSSCRHDNHRRSR